MIICIVNTAILWTHINTILLEINFLLTATKNKIEIWWIHDVVLYYKLMLPEIILNGDSDFLFIQQAQEKKESVSSHKVER